MNKPKSSLFKHDKINDSDFDNHALAIFRKQALNNQIYREYLEYLNCNITAINKIQEIPFLPIDFFKYHDIKTNAWESEIVFESSGTTTAVRSKHHVKSIAEYHQHALDIFELEFGAIEGMLILGLLPSYLERNNSSLVSMVDFFIKGSNNPDSGFYLDDHDSLISLLEQSKSAKQIMLFGVSFALLDLAENNKLNLANVTIVETGGMKGRREEIVKDELYEVLRSKLGVKNIYSEYGMTELLSQCYGREGLFTRPDSIRVMIRDINDPYTYLKPGRTGGINIIDLANAHTCSFIETKDLGRQLSTGQFEVLGRFDNSDIRGCNLLVS